MGGSPRINALYLFMSVCFMCAGNEGRKEECEGSNYDIKIDTYLQTTKGVFDINYFTKK